MHLAALNTEIVKYTLVVLTVPLWWPFIKELYRELNDALRSEGGLFGRPPTPAELRVMDRELGRYQSPLISQEHSDAGQRQAPRREPRTASSRASDAGPRGREGASPSGAGFSKPRQARGFSRKDERRG